MVIFTCNPQLIWQFSNPITYNLSSYYSGFEDITGLITKISIFNNTNIPANEFIYSPQFDNIYAQSILNNDELFADFLKIVLNATNGVVIILISHDDYRDAITASIIKSIQISYAYNRSEAAASHDLSCIKATFFTPQGISTLHHHKLRFDSLCLNGFTKRLNNLKNSEF